MNYSFKEQRIHIGCVWSARVYRLWLSSASERRANTQTHRCTCAIIRQQQLAWYVLISLCLILHHQAVVRRQADDLIDGIGLDGENKAYEDFTKFFSGDAERKQHSWFDRCQNPFRLTVAVIMSPFQSDLFLSFSVHISFFVFRTFLPVVLLHLDSLVSSATEGRKVSTLLYRGSAPWISCAFIKPVKYRGVQKSQTKLKIWGSKSNLDLEINSVLGFECNCHYFKRQTKC